MSISPFLLPLLLVFPASLASIVGHNPVSFPSVRRAEGTSRNAHNLDLVTERFNLLQDRIEFCSSSSSVYTSLISDGISFAVHRRLISILCHICDSRRILKNRPNGPDFGKTAQSFWPEPTVVTRSSLSSRAGSRLAGYASGEEPDLISPPISSSPFRSALLLVFPAFDASGLSHIPI
jgi:hypothetical protein